MNNPTTPRDGPAQSGQTLVEFALIMPIIMVVFMAVLEVALAFNAFIAVNRASQNAGHLAAIMTNQAGTDCLILQQVEEDVSSPNRRQNIINVVVERTALAGNRSFQEQHYSRVGSMDCTLPDGTEINVPYTHDLGADPLPLYPEEDRCPVLKGCPGLGADRTTVDNIGVKVRYRHDWITPLSVTMDFLPGGSSGWSFTQRNIFRMEPTL